MEFHCVSGCSDCCINREYYPDRRFGKVGVLLLPQERGRMMRLASELGIELRILPRVGVSGRGRTGPSRIIAYQMMGRDANGDTCPFLGDEGGGPKSPHGGRLCRVYGQRPLACAAYPLSGRDPVLLDQKCRFCRECCDTADGNLESETRALLAIERTVGSDAPLVWRFATETGEEADRKYFESGWMRDDCGVRGDEGDGSCNSNGNGNGSLDSTPR